MAKKLGKDYLLWIESATPGTYTAIKGQQDLTYSESASSIDTSSKEDYPYGSSQPGQRSITVGFGCVPDLPDANGWTRFETIAASATPQANFQIRKGGTGGTGSDVVFQALMNIISKDVDYSNGKALGGKFNLTNAGAPTTNALA